MWLIINQMLSRAACFHLTDINHLIIISPIPAPIMVFIQLYVFYLTAWILLNSESLCKTISTIAKYYTPKGTDIHEKGIKPDVEVKMSDKQWKKAQTDEKADKQLKKAIEILKK